MDNNLHFKENIHENIRKAYIMLVTEMFKQCKNLSYENRPKFLNLRV